MLKVRAQEAPSIVDISVIPKGDGVSARCEFEGYGTDSGYSLDLYLRQVGEDGAETDIARKGILPPSGGSGVGMTDEKPVDPGIYKAAVVLDRTDGGTLQVDNFKNSLLYDVVKSGDGYVVTPRQEKEEEPEPPSSEDKGDGEWQQEVKEQARTHREETAQEEVPQKGEESGGDGHVTEEVLCSHSAEYRVVEAASPGQDALMAGECTKCGEVISYSYVPNSAYTAFLEEAERVIRNAADGLAVIETDHWISFNQRVLDAMEERPEVAVRVRYRYNGKAYEVTVPARTTAPTGTTVPGGTGVGGLADENGFCGFRYLDQIFGGREISG